MGLPVFVRQPRADKTTLYLNPLFVSYRLTYNIGTKVLLFVDTHKF